MLERIQSIFRRVFRNQELVITEHTSAKDIRAWDSLTHIELIAAIEDDFGIRFSFNEVMGFNSVGDIIKIINSKTVC